jgi:NAD(P)H dehydrogenase (quinone)
VAIHVHGGVGMKVLVVYCHPVETSFHAALHREVVASLKAAGHAVDDCDLYAEDFNPVMSREERLGYHDVPRNQFPMARYVERLRNAEALVLCFPTWCFGMPAMLKGFFDRLLMPGVAFDISDPSDVKPMLTHIKRISAVVTYGRPRWMAWYMGDPPRRIVTRYLKRLTGNKARVDFHAHYHMNVATEPRLARFLLRVGHAMSKFA